MSENIMSHQSLSVSLFKMYQAKMIQLRHKILLCTDAALSSSLRLTGPEILSALLALLHVEYTETTFIQFISEIFVRKCDSD